MDPLYRSAKARLVTVFCRPDPDDPEPQPVKLTFVANHELRASLLGSQACDFLERLHEH